MDVVATKTRKMRGQAFVVFSVSLAVPRTKTSHNIPHRSCPAPQPRLVRARTLRPRYLRVLRLVSCLRPLAIFLFCSVEVSALTTAVTILHLAQDIAAATEAMRNMNDFSFYGRPMVRASFFFFPVKWLAV